MQRFITAGIVLSIGLALMGGGCSRYSAAYWRATDAEKQKMLNPEGQSNSAEYQLDRAMSEAFDMTMQTIPPGDRHVKRLGIFNPLRFYDLPWRVGLVEAASPNSQPTKLDDYVAEKTMELAGLDEDFNRYFEMTQKSTPGDMLKELNLSNPEVIEPALMAKWGRLHGLDFVITEVSSPSSDMVDITLKLVQIKTGRVVSVGSSKVARGATIDPWLTEPGD
jgi:hypothetical protein